MTRILLISGSTREDSLHNAALRTAARFAPPGITASPYDGLRDLTAFVPAEPVPPMAVTHLRLRVGAADALLFCTPEYAGSLPGSLKNLLDWLIDAGYLEGKPAAWLSVDASGRDDGARATLETTLEHGNARLLRSACIRVPLDRSFIGPDGTIGDARFHQALLDTVRGLARSAVPADEREQPSWQAYSSVFPVVSRRDQAAFRPGRGS
jgi:hypothetical protein